MKKHEKKLYKAEILIALVLRYGVLLCAFIIALGMFLKLTFGHWMHAGANRAVLKILLSGQVISHPAFATSWDEASKQILKLDPDLITGIGIILLIALPFVRVGMTIFVFLFEKDFIYLGITLLVFAILISSLFMGLVI